MCRTKHLEVSLSIPEDTLQEIGRIANDSGFFGLPDNLSDRSQYCTGGHAARLSLSFEGKTNIVYWDFMCIGPSKNPKELTSLLSALDNAIYKNASVKSLGNSDCRIH